MRNLLSKSPEFTSQGFSLETASVHPGILSGHLKDLELAGGKLRERMADLSLRELCGLTDTAVLRTASRSV